MLSMKCLTGLGVVFLGALGVAKATENGASVFPVGVETVMTGMQPHPGQTTFYNFDCSYSANEFDNASGKSAVPDFKLRVVATAFKVTHNWGISFLGGTIDSQVAVPLVYQGLTVPVGSAGRYAVSNVDIIPASVAYNRGIAHWYYEADLFAPGTRYLSTSLVNVGQQNLAVAPVAGITLLPHKGEYEISSRFTYIFNGADKNTQYHSGNEFFWEYNVDREITKKMAIGFNGYFYKQTTDDFQHGEIFEGGFRGRDLAVGPQVRFSLGKHGGFAFKYYRDTLVQNKPRGNAFWFQIALPIGPSESHS
jgi:hypothetical protein